jgi:uncharacterized protein YegL
MHTNEESVPAENGVGARGLPTYVVLDTSGSMSPFEELLNETLTEIVDTLYSSPKVSDFIHLSIVSFNTSPHVVLEMTEISQLSELPAVTCGGTTNYGPMFQLLQNQISQDVPKLSAKGVKVFRPVVFVLTDGSPTDQSGSWHGSHDALIDSNWRFHPNVITYGFGDASEAVLKRVSTLAAYIADKAQRDDTRKALANALDSVLHSLVASAQAQRLLVPEEVTGFRSVPMDYLEG